MYVICHSQGETVGLILVCVDSHWQALIWPLEVSQSYPQYVIFIIWLFWSITIWLNCNSMQSCFLLSTNVHIMLSLRIIIFIAYCPEEVMGGILWPRTISLTEVSLPCSQAGPLFRQGTFTTRSCSEIGAWSDVDLSTCTLVRNAPPFLLVSFVLETEDQPQNVEDLIESSQLENEVHINSTVLLNLQVHFPNEW